MGGSLWLLHAGSFHIRQATAPIRIHDNHDLHRNGRIRRSAERARKSEPRGAVRGPFPHDLWMLQRDAGYCVLVCDESGRTSTTERGDGLADWVWK